MSKLSKPVPRPKHFCKTGGNREPEALRKLKEQLANINCKCGTCAIRNKNNRLRAVIKYSRSATDIQANQTNRIAELIQATPKTSSTEPNTETLHTARTHVMRPPCMNEDKRSGTGCQADAIDCSVDTFIQASNKTATVDFSKQALEFALAHLREPTYTNEYVAGPGVQAGQTECSVDRFIQPSSKIASVDPSTLHFALTHLREPSCISGYTSGTGVQVDPTECSVDRFIQASSENVLQDPSTQALQFAFIRVRKPSCMNEYSSATNVKADQIECAVDRFIQATQTTSVEPKTLTLQNALTQLCKHNVLCPTCALAFSFLRGELSKVNKDEESATTRETNCDKSTLYDVTCNVDRSTSMRLLCEPSSLSLADYFTSKLSSGTSIDHRSSRVRFRDEVEQKQYRMRKIYDLNFMCIESFIDSIRPPL